MRTFKGTIYEQDARDYNLDQQCEMVCIGFWQSGSRTQSSYVFADGSHPEMQFSKDRQNTFYLEAVN